MFVELLESLRCPRDHDEAPLVVSSTLTENRYVIHGTLGCPVCGAEFPIRDGVARFDVPERDAQAEPPSDESAMRIAAFLQLTDAGTAVALCGRFASQAAGVTQLSDVPIVLVNPPPRMPLPDVAACVLVRDAFPVAAGALRGAALDEATSDALARSIVRAVRSRGRLMAPVTVRVPAGIEELARDERVWVGEKTAAPDAAPRLVTLKRASS